MCTPLSLHHRCLCWPAQNLRGKKGEARARQVVETSLILLEGRAAGSDKHLDLLLETLQEVGQGLPVRMVCILLLFEGAYACTG